MSADDLPDEGRSVGVLRVTALVLAPFATGYFMSYIFRTVNSVIGDLLRAEFSLSNSDIGLLTAAYLLGFGLFQIPLGVLLDRFGPRRVDCVLLIVAAMGAVLFSVSNGMTELFIGRTLIGVGVSAALMSSFQAVTLWYPRDRWAAMNGIVLVFGGLGAIAGSEPIQAALAVTDWRTLFQILAAMTAAVSLLIFIVVPNRKYATGDGDDSGPPETFRSLWRGLGIVYRSRPFWTLVPMGMTLMGVGLAIQGLWAGLWLRDVDMLDAAAKARVLLYLNIGLAVGYLAMGFLADLGRRFRIAPHTTMTVLTGLYLLNQLLIILNVYPANAFLWAGFGFLSGSALLAYPFLVGHFPVAYAGRCNTVVNLWVFVAAFAGQFGLGAITDIFSETGADGRTTFPAIGYQVAFGVFLALQAVAWLWYVIAYRPPSETGTPPASPPAPPPDRPI